MIRGVENDETNQRVWSIDSVVRYYDYFIATLWRKCQKSNECVSERSGKIIFLKMIRGSSRAIQNNNFSLLSVNDRFCLFKSFRTDCTSASTCLNLNSCYKEKRSPTVRKKLMESSYKNQLKRVCTCKWHLFTMINLTINDNERMLWLDFNERYF